MRSLSLTVAPARASRLRRFLGASLLASVLTLAACGGPSSGSSCPPTQTLTYDNFGKAFTTTWCTSCHSGANPPEGLDLTTVAAIRANAGEIDEKAAGGPSQINRAMPPQGAGPSDDERKKLGEWLACGAP